MRNTKLRLRSCFVLLSCMLLSIASADNQKIAAWVNDSPIHESHVQEKMAPVIRLVEKRTKRPIHDSIRQKIRDKALDRLIEKEIALTSEAAKNIQLTADAIQSNQNDIIDQKALGDIEQFKAFLSSNRTTWLSWKQEEKDKLIFSKIKETMRDSMRPFTPSELKAFFDQNQDHFYNGGRIKISLITLDPKAAPGGNPRQFATGIQNRIFDAGDSEWKACATEYSCGPKAATGGHWDWQSPADLPFGFANTTRHIKVGEIEKISYGDFFYFIRLDAIEKKTLLGFSDAKPKVEEILMDRKVSESWKSWIKQERKVAKIKIGRSTD